MTTATENEEPAVQVRAILTIEHTVLTDLLNQLEKVTTDAAFYKAANLELELILTSERKKFAEELEALQEKVLDQNNERRTGERRRYRNRTGRRQS